MVCDFHKLNKKLRRHHYPNKDVKELLRSLLKIRLKSVFDVPMCYYVCLLAELNRRAAMDVLLGDLEYVRVYLDGILVFSSSFEEHLLHLREVFTRLQNAGLSLHPKEGKV
ncbi:Pol Polyprotein [Phytophthora cinnamomi]|uniref:Pol Polyprotein n=1 Tax=Phytophthora cinnamomi TaxID=4785 RepID=UPI00355A1F50|nr:Pol Polyprotein [Phytophthora cinnamomi]